MEELPLLRFIPFRRADIDDMCLADGKLTADQQQCFIKARDTIEDHFQRDFHALKQQLKDAYAPLDPDTDTRVVPLLREKSSVIDLVSTLEQVLNRANYEKVTEKNLNKALRSASLFQVRLFVDLNDFQEVLLYTRGASRRQETVREFFGIWRRKIEFTNFDRVVVYIRFKDDVDSESALGDCPPGSTMLKLFQNVPEADLEMLFPNIRVGMRMLDKLMVAVPALVSGSLVVTTKLGATLILMGSLIGFWLGMSTQPVELDKAALLVLLAGTGALVGYLWKQFSNFRNRKLKYTQALTENLYFKLLDNNAGVLYRILDDAEESECKESLLAYYFLLAQGEPMTVAEVDQGIENWLAQRWQCRVNFDIEDALGKLQQLDLARCDGEHWNPVVE